MLVLTHDDSTEVILSEQDVTDVMFRIEAAARCEGYRMGGIVTDYIALEGQKPFVAVLGVVHQEFPLNRDREYRNITMVYVPTCGAS